MRIARALTAQLLNWKGRDECDSRLERMCAFEITPSSSPYHSLQWSLLSAKHNVNQVLASLNKCPKELRLAEYKRFACMRAGHRLQAANVLDALNARALSFEQLPVLWLVAMCMWQVGPMDVDVLLIESLTKSVDADDDNEERASTRAFCPASHAAFRNASYLQTLHDTLAELLDKLAKKWNDHVVLYCVIVVVLRAITMTPRDQFNEQVFVELLVRCRHISHEWERTLHAQLNNTSTSSSSSMSSTSDHSDKESNMLNDSDKANSQQQQLTHRLICVCAFTLLTFDVDERYVANVMRNEQDALVWLTSMQTLRHLQRRQRSSHVDYFQSLLMRQVEACSLRVQAQFERVCPRVLTKFVSNCSHF